MDGRMLILAVVALLSGPGALSRNLSSKLYSIHKDKRTWNEARAICEAEGGMLAKFNRNETFNALTAYRDTEGELWMMNVKSDIWIGLNSPAPNNKYRWANCKPLTSDHWTSPGRLESGSELCVVADRNTCTWEPEKCRERHQYVCEVKTGPSCTYSLTNGHCDDGAETRRSFKVENQTECQERCDNEYTSGLPCWMFIYGSPECRLFFATIPWQCGASTSNTSATVGIRSCFTFRFHESTTKIPDDESNFPITSCDVNSTTASSTTGLNDEQSVQPTAASTYTSTQATSQGGQNSNDIGKAPGDDLHTWQTTTPSGTQAASQAAQHSNDIGEAPGDDPDTTQTTTQPSTTATTQPTTTTTPPPTTTTSSPPTTTTSPPTTTTTHPPTTTTTSPPTTTTAPPPTTTTTSLPTTTTTRPPTTTSSPPTTTTTSHSTTAPPPTSTTTSHSTTSTTPPTTTTTPPPITTTIPPPTTTTTPPPTTTTTHPPTTTTIPPPTTTTTPPSTTTTTSPPTTTTTPTPTTTTTPPPTTTTTIEQTSPTKTQSDVAYGPSAASQIDVDNKTSDTCPCRLCVMVKNSTEIQNVIDEIRVWLKVDQSTLSAVRRKRISQADDRPSATVIGYSGIVFIATVVSVFIISDVLTICQHLAKKK